MSTTDTNPLQDLEAELLRNNITKVDLADELGRHRVTVHKWLADLTPVRRQALQDAIKSIMSKRGV